MGEFPLNKLQCSVTGGSPVASCVVEKLNQERGDKIHNFHYIIHQ
jgi:hypothetical protein